MRLVIRADATPEIGTGHVMRCIALAHAWRRDGGDVDFVTRCTNIALLQRMQDVGAAVRQMDSSQSDCAGLRDCATSEAVLVLDGYDFNSAYQQQVKELGFKLAIIDDLAHLPRYVADVIVNQNLGAETLHYVCEPHTRLLLGSRYALLRPEFQRWTGWERTIPRIAKKVLVTLGGSDPENATGKVLRALRQQHLELQIIIVAGPANPRIKELQDAVAGDDRIRVVVNPPNMDELMAWADFAITAAGSTCWELAFMGAPMITIVVAENQRSIGPELEAAGIALNLGASVDVSEKEITEAVEQLRCNSERRAAMSRGSGLVDGLGADRVAAVLKSIM